MKKLLIVLAFSFVWPTFAQSVQQEYVPFTVDQKDYDDLVKFLNDQPFKIASPLLQWLNTQEQMAISAKKEKSEKSKDATPKK